MNASVMNPLVVLKAQGLVKQFGGITATDNVNLELRLGARHALIGPNGAGKTTLLRCLAGLDAPIEGAIEVGGVDVLVRRYLHNPITHSVDDDATTEPDMEHHVLTVTATEKSAVVRELAAGESRSVLFTRTKHAARKLARDLTVAGVPDIYVGETITTDDKAEPLPAIEFYL